eukprot:scaffold15819_cov24-Phaeocystis_antarctica.AAC.1
MDSAALMAARSSARGPGSGPWAWPASRSAEPPRAARYATPRRRGSRARALPGGGSGRAEGRLTMRSCGRVRLRGVREADEPKPWRDAATR